MLTKLDQISWVKGKEHRVLRFNACIFLEPDSKLLVKGFRIRDGYISPPAFLQGRCEYPNIYFPQKIGESIVDAVLTSQPIRVDFPEIFPLVSRDALVSGLLFDEKFKLRDFPNI